MGCACSSNQAIISHKVLPLNLTYLRAIFIEESFFNYIDRGGFKLLVEGANKIINNIAYWEKFETRAVTVTLSRILHSKPFAIALYNFLLGTYTNENFEYWYVLAFVDSVYREKWPLKIYMYLEDVFLRPGSFKEININHAMSLEIRETMNRYREDSSTFAVLESKKKSEFYILKPNEKVEYNEIKASLSKEDAQLKKCFFETQKEIYKILMLNDYQNFVNHIVSGGYNEIIWDDRKHLTVEEEKTTSKRISLAAQYNEIIELSFDKLLHNYYFINFKNDNRATRLQKFMDHNLCDTIEDANLIYDQILHAFN